MQRSMISACATLLLFIAACGESSPGSGDLETRQPTLPFTILTDVLPDAQVGAAYSHVIQGQGGTGTYTWSIGHGQLPPGMSFIHGPASATFSGTPTAQGFYALDVQAVDSSKKSVLRHYTLLVKPAQPLTIATTSLPDPVVGVPYNETVFSAGGSLSGYKWSATGAFPPGLKFAAQGLHAEIRGTPTVAGTFGIQLELTDDLDGFASHTFTLISQPFPTIQPIFLPAAGLGFAYSQTLSVVGGSGAMAWSVESGALPPGITLTGAGLTAMLQGTPGQTGQYNFVARIQDSLANVATRALSLTVLIPTPVTITTTSLANGIVNVPYVEPLVATGGGPPFVWTVTQAVLPPGLAIRGGFIDGTPTTMGTYNFVATVTDLYGQIDTQALSITVGPPVFTIARAPNLDACVEGFDYAVRFPTANGTAPINWQLSGGALPPGFEFVPGPGDDAMLFGSTVAVGSYSFSVTATDAGSQVSTRVYFLDVLPTAGPVTIATQYLGEWTTTFDVFVRMAAVGGTGQGYTWSLQSGSVLPPGVALVGDTLQGVPAQQGSFTFALEVTDAVGAIGVRTYSLEVIDAGPSRPQFAPSAGNHLIRERSVFVLDASGSMFGARIAVLRAEMSAAIAALPPHYKFDLVAFGSQFPANSAYTESMWGSLTHATDANRLAAIQWINGPSLDAVGGTPAYPALQDVCFRYAPDLKSLFFLSDGAVNQGGSATELCADIPAWWSAMDECHFNAVAVGTVSTLMPTLAALLNGSYIAI